MPFPQGPHEVAPMQTPIFEVTQGRVVPKRKDATNNTIGASGTHDTLTLTAESNHVYEVVDICVIPDLVPDGQIAPTSNLNYLDFLIGDKLMLRAKVNNIGMNSLPFPTVTSLQKPLLSRLREIAMYRQLTHAPDPMGIRDGRNLLHASRYWIDEGESSKFQFKASATAVANSYYILVKYREYLQTQITKKAKWLPGGTASQMRLFYSIGTNKVAGTTGSTENPIDLALNQKGSKFPWEAAVPDNRWFEVWGIGVTPALHQEETSLAVEGETVGADINVGFLTNPQINEMPFGDDADILPIQNFEEPIIITDGQKMNLFFENDASVAVPIAGINVAVWGVEHLTSL